MQPTIVSRLRRPVCHEKLDWVIKPEPFRDARFQLIFPLQLLINQEIIPVGVVLDRSDSMGRGIVEC